MWFPLLGVSFGWDTVLGEAQFSLGYKYITAEIVIGTVCLLDTSAKQFTYIQDYKFSTANSNPKLRSNFSSSPFPWQGSLLFWGLGGWGRVLKKWFGFRPYTLPNEVICPARDTQPGLREEGIHQVQSYFPLPDSTLFSEPTYIIKAKYGKCPVVRSPNQSLVC